MGKARNNAALAPHKGQRRPFKKQKGPKGTTQNPLAENGCHDDVDVSDEDIAFVHKARSRLGFLENFGSIAAARPAMEAKLANVALERHTKNDPMTRGRRVVEEDVAAYERLPRTVAKENGPSSKGLPTKTFEGELVPAQAAPPERLKLTGVLLKVSGVQVEDVLAEESKQAKANGKAARLKGAAEDKQTKEAQQQKGSGQALPGPIAPERTKAVPAVLVSLQKLVDTPAKRREAAQQAMAVAAHKLLENPNENIPDVKVLNGLVVDSDSLVSRLAMLTATAVMKDIVPGYRIRLPTEQELQVKVTKDVQRERDFESALLSAYRTLLKGLQAVANGKPPAAGSPPPPIQHTRIALKCMCTLLCSVPHFNYTSDILQVVVPRMASKDAEMSRLACHAVTTTIKQDTQGRLAREVVQLVADLVKRRKCICRPCVVQSLAGIDFSEVVVEDDAAEVKGKGGKSTKVKRGKKRQKTEDEVDQAFKEAHAGPNKEEQATLQSHTLEALFEVLFRILKQAVECASRAPSDVQWTRADMDRKCPMLGAALQALSRYMYLASVEYFNDLMEVVKQLAKCAVFPMEERLGCLLTATNILRGRGEALTVDQRQFYIQLYGILLETPLQRVSESQEEPAGASEATGQPSTLFTPPSTSSSQPATDSLSNEAVLLSQLCSKMLCEVKMADMGRAAAFLKRLACISLHSSTAEAMGLLMVAFRLLQRYPKLLNLLEWEGEATVGGRAFNPNITDPSEAGALTACLWDLNLLQRHYHPHVQQAATALLNLSPGSTSQPGGVLTSSRPPEALAALYSTSKGLFHPAPNSPGKTPKGRQPLSKGVALKWVEDKMDWEQEELENGLRKHFRLNRSYDRNRSLRKEHQQVVGMLHCLKQHTPQ